MLKNDRLNWHRAYLRGAEGASADFQSQKLTSTGDEAKGVISRLHVLPEVHVGVVEDVRVQVEVVEALR